MISGESKNCFPIQKKYIFSFEKAENENIIESKMRV